MFGQSDYEDRMDDMRQDAQYADIDECERIVEEYGRDKFAKLNEDQMYSVIQGACDWHNMEVETYIERKWYIKNS